MIKYILFLRLESDKSLGLVMLVLYFKSLITNHVQLFEYSTDIGLGVMVLNVSFNNISVISWWSGLLVEKTGILRDWNQTNL
jgi:hypothetical protein